MKIIPFILCLLISWSLCLKAQDSTINRLADQYVKQLFINSPEFGTFYGIPNADNGGLSDNSITGIKEWQHFEETLLLAVNKVDRKALSKAGYVTYKILREQLSDDVGCEVCKTEYWGIDQVGGWQVNLSELAAIQPTGSDLKRRATLARWAKIPDYINNETAKLKEGVAHGYTVPQTNVRLVIREVSDMIKDTVEKSPFFAPALADTNKQFSNQLDDLIRSGINPALKKYRDYLLNKYLPEARTTIGLYALPNGTTCYRVLLRASTSLDITPEQVYDKGLQAIREREEKIRALGKKVYGTDDLVKIEGYIARDTTNNFTSREEILDYSKAAIARSQAKVPQYFDLQPKAPITITVIPAFEEASGYPHYEPAPEDKSRPGTYYIDLYQPRNQNKGTAEVTAFHETYPGHHLQLSIASELNLSSPVSKYIGNSGFMEGWARYCETLADEMGLYSSDKNRLILYSEMPTGMVVDPGIHFMRWTREQAIRYTLAHQPSENRQFAESYVDRIASIPAQMTTYGIGELEFRTLRKLAEARLGEKFDLKEFHDKCLEQGTVTLNMLSTHINEWLQEKK